MESIRLTVRLEKSEQEALDWELLGPAAAYKTLSEGFLQKALAVAKEATTILVNFDDFGYFGPVAHIKTIMGDTVWPKLKYLNLECIKFSEDDLVNTLKRQPALKFMCLGSSYLTTSHWGGLLKKLKKADLKLASFEVTGVLTDSQNLYVTEHIDASAYIDDRIVMEMSALIDDFVTSSKSCYLDPRFRSGANSPEIWDTDEEFCPFDSIDWDDPDELFATYGYPEDSDMDLSDEDEEDDEIQVKTEDVSEPAIPDLVPMDLD